MKKWLFSISKTEMASVIAILIILGAIIVSTMSMLVKPVDKDLSILIIGQIYSLASFVAGYYFNKKSTQTKGDS